MAFETPAPHENKIPMNWGAEPAELEILNQDTKQESLRELGGSSWNSILTQAVEKMLAANTLLNASHSNTETLKKALEQELINNVSLAKTIDLLTADWAKEIATCANEDAIEQTEQRLATILAREVQSRINVSKIFA